MSLFTFKPFDKNKTDDEGNPITDGRADLITSNAKDKTVNVVTDYAWTINPKTAREDVPYIYLIERKLTNNVMVQQLLYNIRAGAEIGKDILNTLAKTITDEKNVEDASVYGEPTEKSKIQQTKENTDSMFDNEQPYLGLYDLEDTGWAYVLPYFDKQNHNIGGNWGLPGEADGGFNKVGAAISNMVGDFAQGVNQISSVMGAFTSGTGLARVGTYIEKAKQYNFESQGPKYTVEFNLYNTGKMSDVIDNWELCFALMYNLLPNRRSKTLFDPPPLYEVSIPGVRRSPVSFIAGMQVNFLGATRIMDLDVGGQPQPLRCIVPDAYSLRIDIEDVLPESKNFMQSMIREDEIVRVSRVRVGDQGGVSGDITMGENGVIDLGTATRSSSGSSESVTRTLAQQKLSENNGITRISLN